MNMGVKATATAGNWMNSLYLSLLPGGRAGSLVTHSSAIDSERSNQHCPTAKFKLIPPPSVRRRPLNRDVRIYDRSVLLIENTGGSHPFYYLGVDWWTDFTCLTETRDVSLEVCAW